MGLDQYSTIRGKEFYWRKHARLQKFMSKEYEKQNPNNKDKGSYNLGFNGGPVIINKEVLDRLEEAIKDNYYRFFAHDGFFWGQQFQEETVKEYEEQDKQYLKAARNALKKGEKVTYECSW